MKILFTGLTALLIIYALFVWPLIIRVPGIIGKFSLNSGPTLAYDGVSIVFYWLPLSLIAAISLLPSNPLPARLDEWLKRRPNWKSIHLFGYLIPENVLEWTNSDWLMLSVLLVANCCWLIVPICYRLNPSVMAGMPARRRLHRSLKSVGNEFGYAAIWNFVVAMFFVLRRLSIIRSTYFKRLPFHRICGWISVVWLFVHTVVLYVFMWMRTSPRAIPLEERFMQWLGQWWPFVSDADKYLDDGTLLNFAGFIGWLAACLLAILSIERIRRQRFRVFLYSHRILAVLFVVMTAAHAPDLVFYMMPALLVAVVDRLSPSQTTRVSSRFSGSAKLLASPHHSVVKVILRSRPGTKLLPYQPGCFVRLNVPDINTLDWHPFSVASLWEDDQTTMIIYLRAIGGFTTKMKELALSSDSSASSGSGKEVRANVDGYFLNSLHTKHHSLQRMAVYIAGGLGIASFLPHIIQRIRLNKRVKVFWSVRDAQELPVFKEFLQMASSCSKTICELEIFISGSSASQLSVEHPLDNRENSELEFITEKSESRPTETQGSGRLLIPSIVELLAMFGVAVGVFVVARFWHPVECGGKSLLAEFVYCSLQQSLLPATLSILSVYLLCWITSFILYYPRSPSSSKGRDCSDDDESLLFQTLLGKSLSEADCNSGFEQDDNSGKVDLRKWANHFKFTAGRIDADKELRNIQSQNEKGQVIIDVYASGPEQLVKQVAVACKKTSFAFHRESFQT